MNLIPEVTLEARDGALGADGPSRSPFKAHGIQVERVGVGPVNSVVVADIGSVGADRGKTSVGK
jgi:hypothetical protein